jgi:HK97 family phage prohead protease
MLADHDPKQRVGIWEEMREDGRGLYVRGRLLTEKSNGKDAYIDLKSGALDGLSIGGRTVSDAIDGRKRARLIKEFDLYEISLVSFPMNEMARITAVKAAQRIGTIREFEDFLRDEGGFSHAAAKAISAGGFKAMDPRDEARPDTDPAIEAIRARFRALHAA